MEGREGTSILFWEDFEKGRFSGGRDGGQGGPSTAVGGGSKCDDRNPAKPD